MNQAVSPAEATSRMMRSISPNRHDLEARSLRSRQATLEEEREAVRTSPESLATVRSLGDEMVIRGTVVHGDARGRELGFPTANLAISAEAPWVDGVWAAEVWTDDKRYLAAVSLGHRPTYYGDDGARLVEAHILDFAGDLYGRTLSIRLRRRLRPQRKFGSTVALIRQMRKDVIDVRRWADAERSKDRPARNTVLTRATVSLPIAGRNQDLEFQRTRRIAAAVQLALTENRLEHAHVADLADVPLGFLRWRYPTGDALREVAGETTVEHSF